MEYSYLSLRTEVFTLNFFFMVDHDAFGFLTAPTGNSVLRVSKKIIDIAKVGGAFEDSPSR